MIAFPGRSGPQKHTRMLVEHGYGVLLFDRRGEGASEGDPNTFGWVGDRDLHAATDYLHSRPDVDPERIGAIGLSVGGEMLIHAAAHSDAFKAVVSEGGSGQSIRDHFENTSTLDAIMGFGACDGRDGPLHQHPAAAHPEERDREDRTDRHLPRLRRERAGRQRGEAEQAPLRGCARAEADLGSARTASTSPGSRPSRPSTSAA